ncbi:MAG: FmdB family zinc ribbon protein [Pseudomonadota bacterium]
MPIYAYKCGSCGHSKDVLQKISDAPLTVCPACGAESFSKQVTAAGFQLKGSGWYATDFRNGSSKAPAADQSADKGAADKADKPAEKSADKPADGGKSDSPAPAPASPKSDAPGASAGGRGASRA